jgi:hypothetical protein
VYLSVEEFEETTRRLVELRSARRVWILISPTGANFTFADIEDDSQLHRRAVEVEEAVDAVLFDRSAESFAARRNQPPMVAFGMAEEPDTVENAARKLDIVREAFPIDELKRRRWVKRTSKIATPSTFEWETVTKDSDDGASLPTGGPVRFGVLRVVAGEPGPVDTHHQQVVMAVDAEDADFLISALTDLRATLRGSREQR